MPTTLTRLAAERHEALYLRLQALVKHTEAAALRRPAARVPEAMRVLAEGLLFDARPFLGRHPRGALPAAASDYGGLAAQLGQALAGVQAFEARHAFWDGKLGCFVWSVAGEALPVKRLRPEVATRPTPAQSRESLWRHLAPIGRHPSAFPPHNESPAP